MKLSIRWNKPWLLPNELAIQLSFVRTLGGTGGGMCDTEEELRQIAENGLKLSPVTQCLIEKVLLVLKKLNMK